MKKLLGLLARPTAPCSMAGQCYTFTPICGTSQWEFFAFDRNN